MEDNHGKAGDRRPRSTTPARPGEDEEGSEAATVSRQQRWHDPEARVYCMVLRHRTRETVQVGARGVLEWPPGRVYYVGRARRGWPTRIKRFAGDFTPHWHIDYLAASDRARLTHLLPLDQPADRECSLARRVADLTGGRPVLEGFGASDCTESCRAHGWISRRNPDEVFSSLLSAPGCSGWLELGTDRCRWIAGRG